MALEDAAVFAALFSRLGREDQIGAFVGAYQEIREARIVEVRRIDISNAAFVRMPPGPERDKRDESLRHARGEWDDGQLQREFEGVAALFGYEALDAAGVSVVPRPFLCSPSLTTLTLGMVGQLGPLPKRRGGVPGRLWHELSVHLRQLSVTCKYCHGLSHHL